MCHIGDALAEEAVLPGGFAGIVVDLFAEGQILPALCEVRVLAICDAVAPHSCSKRTCISSKACLLRWVNLTPDWLGLQTAIKMRTKSTALYRQPLDGIAVVVSCIWPPTMCSVCPFGFLN